LFVFFADFKPSALAAVGAFGFAYAKNNYAISAPLFKQLAAPPLYAGRRHICLHQFEKRFF